jgi:uncharacterized damage-inducible protein DinB
MDTSTSDGPIPRPIEPPYAGDERTMLLAFLEFQRTVLLRKGEGLTAGELGVRLGPSTLTLGRLLRHMTFVEDHWFQTVLVGAPGPEPWVSAPWDDDPDWEMTTADGRTFAALADDFSAACDRSRVTLATHHDLDLVAPGAPPGRPVTLRWILIHMIDEYARHCGHADLLREAVDGRTGD